MAWVKIDDHFDEHPKLAAIGPLGWGYWLAGLAYCNRNLTDGFIPWSKARTLASFEMLEAPAQAPAQAESNEQSSTVWALSRTSGMSGEDITADWVVHLMVRSGLWDEVPGGYKVHDYEDFQPTKAQVLAERDAKRRAGAAGGKASAQARAQAGAQAGAQAESNPVPVPVPNEKKKEAEPKAKRAAAVPDDFAVTEALVTWGEGKGYSRADLDGQVDLFVAHHKANGTTYKDWHAAFQKWMHNARQYGHLDKPAKGRSPIPLRPTETEIDNPFLLGPDRVAYERQKWIEANPEEAKKRGWA